MTARFEAGNAGPLDDAPRVARMWIYTSEWYPVYQLDDEEGWGDPVDVSSDLAERYRRVAAEFDEVQRQLRAISDQMKEVDE